MQIKNESAFKSSFSLIKMLKKEIVWQLIIHKNTNLLQILKNHNKMLTS